LHCIVDIVAVFGKEVECCFDEVERCFDIVIGVDRALASYTTVVVWWQRYTPTAYEWSLR